MMNTLFSPRTIPLDRAVVCWNQEQAAPYRVTMVEVLDREKAAKLEENTYA